MKTNQNPDPDQLDTIFKKKNPYNTPTVFNFFIPSHINLEELLTTHGRKLRFIHHYAFIISSIFLGRVKDKRYTKESYIPLNHEVMVSMISKRKLPQILNDLKEWDIIESDGIWKVGVKSTGYRLKRSNSLQPTPNPLMSEHFTKITVNDKLINKKMNLWKCKEYDLAVAAGSDYQHLYENLIKITIDYSKAKEYITSNYQILSDDYNSRILSVELINQKNFFFVIDKKGRRAHTNLTNLASDLRQFIRVKGVTLCQVDLKNSQPMLLNLVIHKMINQNKQDQVKEYKLFKEKTEQGEFYEFLMKKFNIVSENRAEFKKLFFGRVFFDVNRTELKKEEKMFQELFPTIFGLIRELKVEDYTQLAIRLQRAESGIIINECIRKIAIERPKMFVSTIHDSIVCTCDNLKYVKEVMQDIFEVTHNLKPTFKMEAFYGKI